MGHTGSCLASFIEGHADAATVTNATMQPTQIRAAYTPYYSQNRHTEGTHLDGSANMELGWYDNVATLEVISYGTKSVYSCSLSTIIVQNCTDVLCC